LTFFVLFVCGDNKNVHDKQKTGVRNDDDEMMYEERDRNLRLMTPFHGRLKTFFSGNARN
jgi:hypothetical protein